MMKHFMKPRDLFNILSDDILKASLSKELKSFFETTRGYTYNKKIGIDTEFTLEFYKYSERDGGIGCWKNSFQIISKHSCGTSRILESTITETQFKEPIFTFDHEKKEFNEILQRHYRNYLIEGLLND